MLILRDAYDWISWAGNLVLVGVGITGVWVAVRSVRSAETSADAALKSAQAVLTAERAWIVVTIDRLELVDGPGTRVVPFSVRLENKGRSPAFLLETRNHALVLPREEGLPGCLPYRPENVEVWPEPGLPLQPGADLIRHNYSTISKDNTQIYKGADWL